MGNISALKLIRNVWEPIRGSSQFNHCKVFKQENMRWESLSAINTGPLVIMQGDWNYMYFNDGLKDQTKQKDTVLMHS